jgi:hypothetical protein
VIAQVVAGKDKGTVAEVEKVLPTRGMIVVKGVNVKVRQGLLRLLLAARLALCLVLCQSLSALVLVLQCWCWPGLL